jgi:hypothetical protein
VCLNFENDVSLDCINECVNNFSDKLKHIMNPLFKTRNDLKPHLKHAESNYVPQSKLPSPPTKPDDKPWFDDKLRKYHRDYLSALKFFNMSKSPANHKRLNAKKKAYKLLHARFKREYLRTEGDILAVLKVKNPKNYFPCSKGRKVFALIVM